MELNLKMKKKAHMVVNIQEDVKAELDRMVKNGKEQGLAISLSSLVNELLIIGLNMCMLQKKKQELEAKNQKEQ